MQSIQIGVSQKTRFTCPPPPVHSCFDTLPYKLAIMYEQSVWEYIQTVGGIQAYTASSGYKGAYNQPPQLQMPANGQRLDQVANIALPAANSTDTLVLSYRVPAGWDGVIVSLVNFWTGTTFVPGSGDLTWRLKINSLWVKGYGDIKAPYGSLQNRYPLEGAFYPLKQGDLVRYYVNHKTGSALTGGFIFCGFGGYTYPNT